MLATLRKNIQTSFLSCLLGSLVFLILLFSIGSDFFHNHKPDLEHHHDCPALQIYLIFTSVIVQYFVFHFILLSCAVILVIQYRAHHFFSSPTYQPRAPPFQIPVHSGYHLKRKQILHDKNLKGNNYVNRLDKIVDTYIYRFLHLALQCLEQSFFRATKVWSCARYRYERK
jgi:hypothetical protein